MEFALCKSGVREIRYLKDNAKALGRAKGIALHRALDIVAAEEGFPGGWQDVVTSRWTLDKDMQLHKLDVSKQIAMVITFDAIKDPEILSGSKGLRATVKRDLSGGKPRDIINFQVLENEPGLVSDAKSLTLFEAARAEQKVRLRCKLCIHLAEPILQALEAGSDVEVLTTHERLIHDLKASKGLEDRSPMNSGKFIEGGRTINYQAFPSRHSLNEVILIYAIDAYSGVEDIARSKWLDVMTETVSDHGDPRSDAAACLELLRRLGVSIPEATAAKDVRRDGIEEGP